LPDSEVVASWLPGRRLAARRQRPWYKHKVEPTFADMLACYRLHLWSNRLASEPSRFEEKWAWLLEYLATAP
jgi:hypothetical protein